eukprot:3010608-Rhodomonas_salina.2
MGASVLAAQGCKAKAVLVRCRTHANPFSDRIEQKSINQLPQTRKACQKSLKPAKDVRRESRKGERQGAYKVCTFAALRHLCEVGSCASVEQSVCHCRFWTHRGGASGVGHSKRDFVPVSWLLPFWGTTAQFCLTLCSALGAGGFLDPHNVKVELAGTLCTVGPSEIPVSKLQIFQKLHAILCVFDRVRGPNWPAVTLSTAQLCHQRDFRNSRLQDP